MGDIKERIIIPIGVILGVLHEFPAKFDCVYLQ